MSIVSVPVPTHTLTAPEVTLVMLDAGEKKHKTNPGYMFLKAWNAGFILSLGAMLNQIVVGGSPGLNASNPGIAHLIGALVFPIGLISLVLTNQELLTSNMMVFLMSTLTRRTPWWGLPFNWFIVFFGNLAGSLCCAAFLGHWTDLYTGTTKAYAISAAVAKTSEGWGSAVLRGVGCNFMVCLAVWLGHGAKETSSKIMALHFPIAAFVAINFDHIVVNMYTLPLGMMLGAPFGVGKYIGRSMVPNFIGNAIGAGILGIPMVILYSPPWFRQPNQELLPTTMSASGGVNGVNDKNEAQMLQRV